MTENDTTNKIIVAGQAYDIVAEQGDGGGDYQWGAAALLRSADGQLFFTVDGGCSCNYAWDDITPDDLTPVQSWQEAVDLLKADGAPLFDDADVASFAQQLMDLRPAPSAKTPTEDDLGQPATCEQCGRPGEWVIDPYAEEIRGVRIVTALCGRCCAGRAQDI